MTQDGPQFIDRAALEDRLEPLLLRRLGPTARQFRLRSFVPRITSNRLDLATKIAFLDSLKGPVATFPRQLYDRHIAAFSLGEMAEPGDPSKQGPEAFRAAFVRLHDSMAGKGFDPNLSLIPLARDGTILNGAHRVACALHLGIPLIGVETGLDPFLYDGNYFHGRGMLGEDLDAMALAHVAKAPDTALALFWPAAPKQLDKAEALLGQAVYLRQVRLSMRGAHNLLSEVYTGEPWIGPAEKGFPGIATKLERAFSSERPLRVMVLHMPGSIDRVALEAQVRGLWRLAEHSVHITDTWDEAIRISRLLFNRQSLHFLDHAAPYRFPELARDVEKFRARVTQEGGDPTQTVLGPEMVMGAYGLRQPHTVDVLSGDPVPLSGPHDRRASPQTAPALGDILSDPELHFHFWNQRFLSLPVVARAKAQSDMAQDKADMAQITPLLHPLQQSPWLRRIARLRRIRARLKHAIIGLLDLLGVKDIVRRLYRTIRPRA